MSDCGCEETEGLERKTLRTLLAINATMFVIEAAAGWFGDSTGLLADSLDMFADAAVYGVALYAVGRSASLQRKAAAASGVLQLALGVGVLADVVRRYGYGSEPVSGLMIGIGAVAFAANVACLMLLAKHREGGVHMRASWIFSTNDVLANIGVVVSGLLIRLTGSPLPDLVIGGLISALVIRGGIRILRDAKNEQG